MNPLSQHRPLAAVFFRRDPWDPRVTPGTRSGLRPSDRSLCHSKTCLSWSPKADPAEVCQADHNVLYRAMMSDEKVDFGERDAEARFAVLRRLTS